MKIIWFFYKANYGPENADVIVVSNIDNVGITKHLKVLNNWKGQSTQMPVIKAFPELAAGTLYFIDKPDAAQSEIRIGKRAMNYQSALAKKSGEPIIAIWLKTEVDSVNKIFLF